MEKRNNDVCDSPNLYFAISPSGTLKTCCDYEATKDVFIYDKNFPELYFSGKIQEIVYPITKVCGGCMYGSYPEITITARYLKAFMERVKYFNFKPPKIKKYSSEQLQQLLQKFLMSKIKSLQYLLLDSLNKRDKKLSKNLSKTLKVSENNIYYIINWLDDGNLKQLEIEKFKFNFYLRNDIEKNKKDLKDTLKTNNENAEYIVDKILKGKKKLIIH